MCNDPVVNQLSKESFVTIYPPRFDAGVRDVFELRDGTLIPWGRMIRLFESSAEVPPSRQGPAPAFTKALESKHEYSVGLAILGSVIGALTGEKLSLTAAYKDAKSFTFTYGGVDQEVIDPADLDVYLSNGNIRPDATVGAKLLEADRLCVAYHVLRATKITVKAHRSDGTTLKVDVPVIREIVGANIAVSTDGNEDGVLTYDGVTPLTFGLRAKRLIYEDGKLQMMKEATPSGGARALVKGKHPPASFKDIDFGASRLSIRPARA